MPEGQTTKDPYAASKRTADADREAPSATAVPSGTRLARRTPLDCLRDGWQEGWHRWRPSVKEGFTTWVIALAVYVAITAVAWVPFDGVQIRDGHEVAPPPDSLADAASAWNQWDTVWYLIIADSGYEWDPRSTAFFPLYPMLVRLADPFLPGASFPAALILSMLACLAALIVVHRLATEVLGAAGGNRAVSYLIAFPAGFYLAAAYNESIFLALATGSLYAMRHQRWWWAGLLAGFASATRMAGAVLAVAFLYEYLRQRGWSWRHIHWDVLAVALAPAGLALYCLYLWQTFGDPLHFLESQRAWFRTGFVVPWTSLAQTADLIVGTQPLFGPTNLRNIINLGTALTVLGLLGLALAGPWKLGRQNTYMVVFAAAVILMPLSNPLRSDYPLSSMWRFALECLPAFLVLANLGLDKRFERLYLAVALALQGAMIVAFLHGSFVA